MKKYKLLKYAIIEGVEHLRDEVVSIPEHLVEFLTREGVIGNDSIVIGKQPKESSKDQSPL